MAGPARGGRRRARRSPVRGLRPPEAGPGGPRAVPFVGLTGGLGAGKSTALAGARAPGRGDAVHRRGRARAVRAPPRSATRSWSAGAPEVAPGGVVDRAAIAAPRLRRARRARVARGPAVAARGRPGRRLARARSQRRDPPPRAAVVETPLLFEAGLEGALRRDDRGRRRRGRARRARRAHAGTRRSTSGRRASSRRRRRPRARRTWCATTGSSRSSSTSCRPCSAD